MGTLQTPRGKWVDAGLEALAARGVDAVRVEALAQSLGVTKGGFYGYFTDRSALLKEMLDTWEAESVDEVYRQVETASDDVLEQFRLAGRLTFSSERLLPIDLAVREWARRDPAVAERLRRVDDRRMELARAALSTVYADAEEVEARSLLAFCLSIGRHLLAADHPDRTREDVVRRAGELIIDGLTSPPQ